MAVFNEQVQQPFRSTNLREDIPFETLGKVILKILDGRPCDFYPSPGNWGDSLINEGTEQFLDNNNILYEKFHREYAKKITEGSGKPRNVIAIVGGGGGWCRNWLSTSGFVNTLSGLYAHVIVMPTTYDIEVEKLTLPNVTYFSRSKDPTVENALFCHDMAFYLNIQSVPAGKLTYPLIALRRDKERNPFSINPDRNWDLSLLGDSFTPSKGLFEIVSRFATIYTDRLHIGIAGSMLDAKVFLLEGNYNKNGMVFKSSIESNYPNTEMLAWDKFADMKISGLDPIGVSGYKK